MLETYPGILRDNHIEWSGEVPQLPPSREGVRVHVTILEGKHLPLHTPNQGQRMAAILERLAASSATGSISDPLAWERETRQDRPMDFRSQADQPL